MAITVTENIDSRETAKRSSDWHYTVCGTADQVAARQALYDEADGKCGDWKIEEHQVEPEFIDVADPAACIWNGTVTFVPVKWSREADEPKEVGESSYTFDTGGGTQHITHIKSVAHHVGTWVAEGKTAPDPKGGIGATADGIEGVDIVVPVYNFSETHIVADANVTDAYKGKLYKLTGRTNKEAFRGCAPNECLFWSASGSQRGDGDWEITFRFAASPLETGIVIGGITDIVKGGWDYLWVLSERKVSNNMIVVQPVAVYVETVYPQGDFGDLGIG